MYILIIYQCFVFNIQGFVFSDDEPSALVQYEGGPCAVLAPVQAFILKSMLTSKDQWRKVHTAQ
jgi:hypothetical protein